MDICGFETVAEGVHGQQWGIACLIAEIVAELATGEFGTALWLGSDELSSLAIEDVMAHEGECDATEVAAATEAGYDNIRVFTGFLHLLLCLETDDRLMDSHVVEHRTECVLTVRCRGGELYCLTDGSAERTGMARVTGDDVLTCTC